MDSTNDIFSLREFKRRSAELLAQMKTTKRPIFLTENGKAEFVVQDIASYQRIVRLAQYSDAIAGIEEGLASMEAGRGTPAAKAFERLEEKYPFLKGE